jgi:hypothetical protein
MPSKNKGGARAQQASAGQKPNQQPLKASTTQANPAAQPSLKQHGASKAAASQPSIIDDIVDTGIVKGKPAGLASQTPVVIKPDTSPAGPLNISPAVQLPEKPTTAGAVQTSQKEPKAAAAAATSSGPTAEDASAQESAVPDLGLFLDEEVRIRHLQVLLLLSLTLHSVVIDAPLESLLFSQVLLVL